MVKTAFPLAKSLIRTPQEWSKIAQNWLATGVIKGQLNELQVYADSTGMQVKVKSGQANTKGHLFESDAEEILPIATANATNPRIDRVIIRLDYTTDSVDLAILQGVPAVSPVGPALTQNSSRWEISLAYIYVNAGATTIAAVNVTDERRFVKNANSFQEPWITATLQNGAYHITDGDDSGAVFRKNDMLEVKAKATIGTPTATLGTVLWNFPAGYRPAKNTLETGWYATGGGNYSPVLLAITPFGDIKIFSNGGVNGGTLHIPEITFDTEL